MVDEAAIAEERPFARFMVRPRLDAEAAAS